MIAYKLNNIGHLDVEIRIPIILLLSTCYSRPFCQERGLSTEHAVEGSFSQSVLRQVWWTLLTMPSRSNWFFFSKTTMNRTHQKPRLILIIKLAWEYSKSKLKIGTEPHLKHFFVPDLSIIHCIPITKYNLITIMI